MNPSGAGWTAALALPVLLFTGPAAAANPWHPSVAPQGGSAAHAGIRTNDSAHSYLIRADAALDEIQASSSLSSRVRASIATLKRHVTAIRETAATTPQSGEAGHGRKGNWSKDLASAEQVLSNLLGSQGAHPTGGSPGVSGEKLNDATRAQLQEVRTQLRSFAAAMSGGPSTHGVTGPTAPSAGGNPLDADVKRHLTAARNTLNEIAKLARTAQLNEDARVQLSKIISNFDELARTGVRWRTSYSKVESDLNALIGGESAVGPSPAKRGTAGAVGSPGIVELEPTIKAKLIAFRSQLNAFEEAADRTAAKPEPGRND
ncbi:hypothetical protein BH24ACI4_BH24ACI4_13380 [soil metagenome]